MMSTRSVFLTIWPVVPMTRGRTASTAATVSALHIRRGAVGRFRRGLDVGMCCLCSRSVVIMARTVTHSWGGWQPPQLRWSMARRVASPAAGLYCLAHLPPQRHTPPPGPNRINTRSHHTHVCGKHGRMAAHKKAPPALRAGGEVPHRADLGGEAPVPEMKGGEAPCFVHPSIRHVRPTVTRTGPPR